jgi:hypothetical protein
MRIVVPQVNVASTHVQWGIVLMVTGRKSQAGILVEGISARGVGNDPEVSVTAEVVDLGQGSIGTFNHMLPIQSVK